MGQRVTVSERLFIAQAGGLLTDIEMSRELTRSGKRRPYITVYQTREKMGVPRKPDTSWKPLAPEDVLALRERRDEGESLGSLAAAFAISKSSVCNICCGRKYPEVGGPLQTCSSREAIEEL